MFINVCNVNWVGVLSQSSKYRDKRAYVWAKIKRTCVLLAIGGQERQIQNLQVNFIRRKKRSVRALLRLALKNRLYQF